MANKNINQLTELAESPAVGDMIPIWDADGASTKKVSYANFLLSENFWQRTSTTISPQTANDSVSIGTGSFIGAVFDTNVASAGVTLTATTLSADGTDGNISITITPKGTGSVVMSKVDINSGTIDGATIATSDITVGTGKTLNVSAGTLSLADNQISGDKVEGGTINATTITTLTSTTVLGTTFDTNVESAGVTLAGTTLSADGTDANISLTLTPKGSGVITSAKGYAMTGAVTTGLLISGATTTAISITGNASDAIKIETGTFSTGINLGGTLTTGIYIGNCTTSIHANGDAVGANARAFKGTVAVNNANFGDGYGLVEAELTLKGTTAGHVSASSSWVNMTTGTHSAGYICAQNNGVYEEATATITGSKIVFGMRAQYIVTDTDAGGIYPFSINTNNKAITSIFDVNNATDLGLITNAGSDNGTLIPFYKDSNGNIGYVKIYASV